jgi:hypothetical protein
LDLAGKYSEKPEMADKLKVDKQQFDAVLAALLKAPPTPTKSFKGKKRAKKEHPLGSPMHEKK